MMYRRHVDEREWHAVHLCAKWPTSQFEQSDDPHCGPLCEQCARFMRVERDRGHDNVKGGDNA